MSDALIANEEPLELVEDKVAEPVVPEIEEEAFELSDDDMKFIKESGGVEYLQSAKELYERFTSIKENEDGSIDASPFLAALREYSPSRYEAVAGQIYEAHKGTFQNWALQDIGVTRQDFEAAKEWFAAGKPELRQEEELDPNNPLHKELLESRRERAESARRQEEYNRQLQAQKAQEWETKVLQDQAAFDNERLGIITKEIDKMNLGTDDLGKAAKELITAYAQYRFNNDQQAEAKYKSALGLISKGEKRLAKDMAGDIDRKVQFHTAQAAKIVGDLLQAKRDKQGATTTQIQSRRDITPTATGVKPATPLPDDSGRARAQFSPRQALLSKLKTLEAEGRFS